MSDTTLPPIFIESSSHCGGMTPGLPDMWAQPGGKFVRAVDYLALKQKYDCLLITSLAAEHVRDLERRTIEVLCGRCGEYVPGHATGAGDICDCFPRDETYVGDIKRDPQ